MSDTDAPKRALAPTLMWGKPLSVWEIANLLEVDLEGQRMAEHKRWVSEQLNLDGRRGLATLFLRLGIKNLVLDAASCYRPIETSHLDAIVALLVSGPEPLLDSFPLLVPGGDLIERTLFTRKPMEIDLDELHAPSVKIAKQVVTFQEVRMSVGFMHIPLHVEVTGRKGTSWDTTQTVNSLCDTYL